MSEYKFNKPPQESPKSLDSGSNVAERLVESKQRNCDVFSRDEAEEEYRKMVGRPWNHEEDELACWLYAKCKRS